MTKDKQIFIFQNLTFLLAFLLMWATGIIKVVHN